MKYTLPRDTEINATIIKEAIDYNEERRERFDTLDRYYIGDQDILHREKPDLLHNNKVMINHAKYIVDTNVGYLLGNPVEYPTNLFQLSVGSDIIVWLRTGRNINKS